MNVLCKRYFSVSVRIFFFFLSNSLVGVETWLTLILRAHAFVCFQGRKVVNFVIARDAQLNGFFQEIVNTIILLRLELSFREHYRYHYHIISLSLSCFSFYVRIINLSMFSIIPLFIFQDFLLFGRSWWV